MSAIHKDWERAGGLCCPSCYSAEYRNLADRLERQQARLRIVQGKLRHQAANAFVARVSGLAEAKVSKMLRGSVQPIVTAVEDVLFPRLTDEQLEPFKVRYRRAWGLHRDAGDNDELKVILEREMDECQNHFKMDQWQAFKKTLPGFETHWSQWATRGLAAVAALSKKIIPDK